MKNALLLVLLFWINNTPYVRCFYSLCSLTRTRKTLIASSKPSLLQSYRFWLPPLPPPDSSAASFFARVRPLTFSCDRFCVHEFWLFSYRLTMVIVQFLDIVAAIANSVFCSCFCRWQGRRIATGVGVNGN